MTRDQIRERITGILTEDFDVPADRIRDDASFRSTFGMDSLDVVDFILLLQKDFGYKAPTESYRNLATLSELVDFVAQKVAQKVE